MFWFWNVQVHFCAVSLRELMCDGHKHVSTSPHPARAIGLYSKRGSDSRRRGRRIKDRRTCSRRDDSLGSTLGFFFEYML